MGGVGSSGDKPRKPDQHHLPKVGSPENEEYEFAQKQREVFRGVPVAIGVAILAVILIGWLYVTL